MLILDKISCQIIQTIEVEMFVKLGIQALKEFLPLLLVEASKFTKNIYTRLSNYPKSLPWHTKESN